MDGRVWGTRASLCVLVSFVALISTDALAADLSSPNIPDDREVVNVLPDGSLQIGAVNLKLGGFSELATFWRSRNETADVGSSFAGIPFGNDPRHYEHETRFSARQSRIAALASGDMDEYTHLAAYIEADFLGAGTTSNSVESNSYAPRIRHFYGTLDDDRWGLHILAGQTWSLLTTNTEGIKARNEQIPLTIDAQYVVGFNWTRNPQIRIVKTFSPMISAGISVESPQTVIAGQTPGGVPINANNPGGPLLNSGASYSNDIMPDVVAKIAFDPGWGHYELKGVVRGFTDRADHDNRTTIAGGGGASATIPLIPKYLEIQGSFLAGNGIGRYGSGQMADVTFNEDGSFAAIPEIQALAGIVAHPGKGTDLYAYGGLEEATKTVDGAAGYGLASLNNTGCEIEDDPASLCQGVNKRLWEVTAGVWHDIYNGHFGRAAIGAQGQYVKREAFEGVGGAPSTDEAIVMTSFRYYPFK
ncbi:hypothetical protein [Hyphomicrobium sp.]|uniref:hypothetical protein n=1 Tax=Hyphomicrobium sp. TaxID=82 RepID=UPI002C864EFA|nr:hypothetical protein [Hyphomicrobium sp.]HVZ04771.1 hypothetical protein [Hyphomicrobium sp.]